MALPQGKKKILQKLRHRIKLKLSEDKIIELCFKILKCRLYTQEIKIETCLILEATTGNGLAESLANFLDKEPEIPGIIETFLLSVLIREEYSRRLGKAMC